MPTIRRHSGVEEWFYDVARAYLFGRPREGIHVSDLLAPRKAYWARAMPKPPTNREVAYFLAGRGHEEAFVVLSGLGRYHKVRGEWLGPPKHAYEPGRGIAYEIDVLSPDEGGAEIPIELKTNRRPKVLSPEEALEEYSQAVQQLGMYSAIKGLNTGYLVELHLLARGLSLSDRPTESDEETLADPYGWLRQSRPELVIYQVSWTDEELDTIRYGMVIGKELLEAAIGMGDHKVLPECPPWMCGQEHVRRGPPTCPTCGVAFPPGEALPGGKKRGVLKLCPVCKEISGRRVELARSSETVFVPTCRWWAVCKPAQWAQYHDRFFQPGREEEPEP